MRATLFVIALALAPIGCKKAASSSSGPSASASAAPEQTGVRFKRKLPAAGMVSHIEDSFEMRIDMKNAKGGVGTAVTRDMRKRKRTVDRANDRFATRVTIEYNDYKAEEETDGKKQELPSLVKGKKYVVEWDGSGVVVTYAGGAKVKDEEERELVAEAEWDVGQHGDLAEFIPDTPLRVGQSFDADEKSLRALLGAEKDDKLSVEKATFTFSGTRTEAGKTFGLFDAKIAASVWSKKLELTLVFEVSGKLSVDLETSWLKDVSLDGPVKLKSEKTKDRPEQVEGTGTVKSTSAVEYAG